MGKACGRLEIVQTIMVIQNCVFKGNIIAVRKEGEIFYSTDYFFNFYLIVALYYTWHMLYFTQGGKSAPCPPMCVFLAPLFDISSRDLLLAGSLFKDLCVGFVLLNWVD